jgi:hypothetical protein
MGMIQQHNAGGTIGRIWERGAAVTEEGHRRIFKGALGIKKSSPLDIARLRSPSKCWQMVMIEQLE